MWGNMARRWGCFWRLVAAGAAVVAAVVLTRGLSPTVQLALAGLGFSLALLTGAALSKGAIQMQVGVKSRKR